MNKCRKVLLMMICLAGMFFLYQGIYQVYADDVSPYYYTRNNIEKKLGIKIEGMCLSAGGYMLDFRFRVLNPKKAMPLVDRAVKPYIIHEKTGATFIVPAPPKVGSLRNTVKNGMPATGKVYGMMFANPGSYIKLGDKVTVVAGNIRIKGLTVI